MSLTSYFNTANKPSFGELVVKVVGVIMEMQATKFPKLPDYSLQCYFFCHLQSTSKYVTQRFNQAS